jgi:hypothetical protein
MSTVKQAFMNIQASVNRDYARLLAGRIYTRLLKSTPVDTGRARASWRVTKNQTDPSWESDKDKTSFTPPQMPEFGDRGDDDVYYVTNNVPYIIPLNHGHSQQAGEFFVEQAVEEAIDSFVGLSR